MRVKYKKYYLIVVLSIIALAVSGCSSKRVSNQGKYYQDDGPGGKRVDIESIPNAKPKYEPYRSATLKPYTVAGKRYHPLKTAKGYVKEGEASWYGKKYHGHKTAIGEKYDMYAMTAAHPTLPLPSYARVTNLINNKSVVVRLNDRGPFLGGRIIDLSYVAAQKLGIAENGTGRVRVETVSSSDLPSKSNAIEKPSRSVPFEQENKKIEPALQVGAFSSLTNATKLLDKLFALGYDADVVLQANLYKVVVAKTASQSVKQLKQSLLSHGYISSRVIK